MQWETLNFKQYAYPNTSTHDDWYIANMYLSNKHLSVREIANKTNKSIGEIYRSLERTGNQPNRFHTNHHNVHILADSGLSKKHIAELTGYSDRNIRYIINKKK